MARGFRTLPHNALTMVIWMLVLAAFIGMAFLSNLLRMPVVFPLLAYATWHSYRHLTSWPGTVDSLPAMSTLESGRA